MKYMRVYSLGETFKEEDLNKLYEIINDNLEKLDIEWDTAFYLIHNSYNLMLLVFVDSPIARDDSKEIGNKLRKYFNYLDIPGNSTLGESVYFGEDVSVENLAERIQKWPHESYMIDKGPIIKKNKLQNLPEDSSEYEKSSVKTALPMNANQQFEIDRVSNEKMSGSIRKIANEVDVNGKKSFPPTVNIPPQIPDTRVPPLIPIAQVPPQIPVAHVPPQLPVAQVPSQIPVTQVPPQMPVTQVPPQMPKSDAEKIDPKEPTPITQRTYSEKDNRGTRLETSYKANSYLYEVKNSPEKDPYLNYEFDTEFNAREALLALPCIHETTDTGRLICTEAIWFGNYDFEKKRYFTIIGAHNLTFDLWEQANTSFIKHGGHLISGEQPSKSFPNPSQKPEETWACKVTFLREWQKTQGGITYTYQNYLAPDADSAQSFLDTIPVPKKFCYVVVETPEGNYCRDIDGLYKQ